MTLDNYPVLPSVLQGITSTTESLELTMTEDMELGTLLRSLAATSVGGRALQLGAGSGVLTAWLLDGLAPEATLLAVEPDTDVLGVLQRFLARDDRLSTGADVEAALTGASFDLIVLSEPAVLDGRLDELLSSLAPGGLLVASALADNDEWTADQRQASTDLVDRIQLRADLHLAFLNWSSGVLMASRTRSEIE